MNLLKINTIDRTAFQIIIWWELRRILFNVCVVLFIYLSLKTLKINFNEIEMGTGEDFIFLSFLFFGIVLNLFYTLGWISELLKRQRSLTYAPRFFLLTLLLSGLLYLGLTLYLYDAIYK